MNNNTIFLYVALIILLFFFLLIALHLSIRLWIRRRKASIDNLKNSDPIPTATPLEHPLTSFKSRAKRSILIRFSIFRRVAVLLILSLLIVGVSFPYFDRLPQAIISILVGSAAIITGMAARPFIENFLSGIAITSSKKLNIGDTVLLNDQYGTIEDISATHTVIKLWDWRRYIIPNSMMINHEFINYSLYNRWLWACIEFYVSYDADIQRVKEIAETEARNSPFYNAVEPPSFWVMETNRDTIKCWLAAWASSPSEAWELKADIRTRLVTKLREEGVKTHVNFVEVANQPT